LHDKLEKTSFAIFFFVSLSARKNESVVECFDRRANASDLVAVVVVGAVVVVVVSVSRDRE
jgi:hypothetical protein